MKRFLLIGSKMIIIAFVVEFLYVSISSLVFIMGGAL